MTPRLALPVDDRKTCGLPHFALMKAVFAVVNFVSWIKEISYPLHWLMTWWRFAAELRPATLRLKTFILEVNQAIQRIISNLGKKNSILRKKIVIQ